MSKYCVIGRHGFLGSALAARLKDVSSIPTPDTRVLFHFASHTHPRFNENPEYEMGQVLRSFAELLPYCHEHGIVFVYPSSALVYEKDTQFSMFKKTLEHLVSCYRVVAIGLRIFPVYGPGEQHTVISQWCRQMAAGIRPEVYGDGKQSRDFIHIEDAVHQILYLAEARRQGVFDIGTGVRTTFNDIVRMINEELGTSLQPEYKRKPADYPDGVVCPRPLHTQVSVEAGIRKLLSGLREAVPA
jgi:UDP-glucose 4-epimerase